MVRQLSFKKGLYKYYAPVLFKLYKLFAYCQLWIWNIPYKHTEELTKIYWSHFLRSKMVGEARFFGCRTLRDYKLHKSNKKVAYILGSGFSINNITSQEWDYIDSNFSIGLNQFSAHEFTPDLYLTEFVNDAKFIDFFNKYMLNRKTTKDYAIGISAAYITSCSSNILELANRIPYFYCTASVKTQNENLLEKVVQRYFVRKNSPWQFAHQISNLDVAINFCVNKGFKDIRLLGVDLNDERYFYDDKEDEVAIFVKQVRESIKRLSRHKDIKHKAHATAAPEISKALGNMPITEYLNFLQNKILNSQGVQLSVVNKHSMLADYLPIRSVI